jgi:hypothetical protein
MKVDGEFFLHVDPRIQGMMDMIAFLVECDLFRDRDQLHSKLAMALRFLYANAEGPLRGLATDHARKILSATREGHDAWYAKACDQFDERVKQIEKSLKKDRQVARKMKRGK